MTRLSDSWTPLRYHADQSRLWRTTAQFVACACGRGSGKTELARRRLVRYLPVKKPWSDPIYVMGLPTRDQARRVAWEKLKGLVPRDWVSEIRESDLTIKTVFGSQLLLVGMDKPARIEGIQIDGVVLDESCDQRPKVFDLSVSPTLEHRRAWCWRIGVPKRTGPGAKEFKKCCQDWARMGPNYESYSWPSSTVLTPEGIKAAMERLDAKDFAEQYGASWEDSSGAIFYAFNEKLSVRDDWDYDPDLPLMVGSDFNVSPMAWVIGQKPPASHTGGVPNFRVFDELFISNTNTQATLDRLHAKYSQHRAGWLFFGDATGRARKTSASTSDYAQIKNDERFLDKQVIYPRANPPRADRFAATNAMLCNAAGDRRLFIHPRCEHLIGDLLQRAYEPFTNEPADEGEIGHITDALGYVVWRCWPVLPTFDDGSSQVLAIAG